MTYDAQIFELLRERPLTIDEIFRALTPCDRQDVLITMSNLLSQRAVRYAYGGWLISCAHPHTITTWKPGGGEFARHCATCGERLSLGLALDDETERKAPTAVLVELMAAHYEQAPAEVELTEVEHAWLLAGWSSHRALLANALVEMGPSRGSDAQPQVSAGWLAREMSTHDNRDARDVDAWSWDPMRPVAEQGIEWLDSESERMRESIEDHGNVSPRIIEQTRHDVSASVARHADLPGRVPYAEDQLPIPLDMTPPGSVELDVFEGDEPEHGIEFSVEIGDGDPTQRHHPDPEVFAP